ncbi:unnamed protein product [Plutella xylostella]|uniref:E3 ubiquitin-protein ligase n=1 Tax=Plutella xylostella TaxID=51655 RepID=A0A8S4FNL0_PLUXY|nr:unnamed protein product [Plutella xylostella]
MVTVSSEPERGAERARRAGRGGALGTWGGAAAQPPRVCIMCQEEATVDLNSEPLVLVAFCQYSSVLNRCRADGQGVTPAGWRAARLPAGSSPLVLVAFCQYSSVLSRCRADGQGVTPAGWRAARLPAGSSPLVLVAFCQYSSVLNRCRADGQGVTPAGWRAARLPAGRGAGPHVSSCGHALHAACWTKYLATVHDKENRRPYRLRQPAAFDVGKREYLCPLCERLCNTALPLLPPPAAPRAAPPPLDQQTYADSVHSLVNHQVTLEPVHQCTESCEEMHCTARARSVGAMSSDTEAEPEQTENTIYVSTQCRDLLPPEFLAHFELDEELPVYNENFKALIEDFTGILPGICEEEEGGAISALAALYRATAYSIISTETVLEAEKRPLLGDLPARHKDALHALVRIAAIIPSMWASPNQIAHHAITSLSALERTSPTTQTAFGTLVPLILAAPSLFGKTAGPARPANLAKQITLQVFRSTITRALLATDVSSCNSEPMDDDEEYQPQVDLENLLTFMKELRKGDLDIEKLNPADVWEMIKRQCRGFLRACCLFFHFLSDVTPPTELTVLGGDSWEAMCGYLDLPTTFKELIDTPLARQKALQWSELSLDWFEGKIPLQVVLEPEEPPRLIPLPEDFSELMNAVSEFSCPNSDREDSKYPTMCLICGQILCSQSYCCQVEIRKSVRSGGGSEVVGAAVAHARTCGAGAGLFLRVRDCETLLLAAPARGATMPAPYLDSYGETDQYVNSVSDTCGAGAGLFLRVRDCETLLLAAPARGATMPAPYLDSYGETDQYVNSVSDTCGAGAGLFLRVRDCETLLLAAPARGATMPAPYLDSYGETDQGLRRGNPLHLCPERYAALRMLWLSHGLHERIARGLDTNMLVTTRWQTM